MTWISIFTSLVETSQIRTVWVSRNHATMSWDHEEEVELINIKKRTRRWSKSITRTIGALAEERARRVSLGEEPPADGVNSQKSCLSANVRSDAAKHVRPRSVLRRSVWPPSKSAALTRRGSSLNTQRCWGKGSNGTQDGCGECQRWANSYLNFHLINVSCRRDLLVDLLEPALAREHWKRWAKYNFVWLWYDFFKISSIKVQIKRFDLSVILEIISYPHDTWQDCDLLSLVG